MGKSLDWYEEHYRRASSMLSTLSRQLAYAGIAVVWIFRTTGETTGEKVPAQLLAPLLAFAIALAVDMVHYAYRYLVFANHYRRFEVMQKETGQEQFEHSDWVWRVNGVLFWTKPITSGFGWLCIMAYVGRQLF